MAPFSGRIISNLLSGQMSCYNFNILLLAAEFYHDLRVLDLAYDSNVRFSRYALLSHHCLYVHLNSRASAPPSDTSSQFHSFFSSLPSFLRFAILFTL